MAFSRTMHLVYLLSIIFLVLSLPAWAEAEDESYFSEQTAGDKPDSKPASPKKQKKKKRKYLTDDSPRSDSGIFHVGVAGGGNFYTEPVYDATTNLPAASGEYWNDFGFQAGVYFDWNYNELDEEIPLGLRGMVGYKYVLSSVHIFTFDGMVRRMWRFSENASFGLGFGGSAALWYRAEVYDANGNAISREHSTFLASFIFGAGFDFTPFMADLKILINRWSSESIIAGVELYFGFRL